MHYVPDVVKDFELPIKIVYAILFLIDTAFSPSSSSNRSNIYFL